MRTEPNFYAVLAVSTIVAVAYTQGPPYQQIAGVIILATLITPIKGQDSILVGLLKYLNQVLTEGVMVK